MFKLVLTELKNVCRTWDELVLVDGMKAGKGCIDEMTEMEWVFHRPKQGVWAADEMMK
jgi:hypothetical protein